MRGPLRPLLLLIALLALPGVAPPAMAAPAEPRIWSLFVGIDAYPQTDAVATPAPRLHGAVNDVGLIRKALARRYRLDFGPLPTASDCSRHNDSDTSFTLIETCATRANILGRLEAVLKAARPGDLVLFFFAGHGAARPGGMEAQVKDSDVILPVDAEQGGNHIYDVELRDLLWAAQAHGVSVLTIFDSCSSGTGTRELRPAAAARFAATPPPKPPPLPKVAPPQTASAYLVHLAAVADEGIAVEAPFDDGEVSQVDGVFTRALVDALRELPASATYRDVAERTRWLMGLRGAAPAPRQIPVALGFVDPVRMAKVTDKTAEELKKQQAQAEGALAQRFLGQAQAIPPVFAATPKGALTLVLPNDGRISGVARASTYSVHCGRSDAEADRAPIGMATAEMVEPIRATLILAAPLARPCSADDPPWVREIRHSYAGTQLHLGLNGANAAERDLVKTLLSTDGLLLIDDTTPGFVLYWDDSAGRCQSDAVPAAPAATESPATPATPAPRTLALRRGDGTLIACLGDAAAAGVADRIAARLRALANFHAVADLARGAGDPDLVATIAAEVPDCQPPDDLAAGAADPCRYRAGGTNAVIVGARLTLAVRNPRAPVYANMLLLDGRNLAVTPVYGTANAIDAPIAAGRARELFRGTFKSSGDLLLLVLLTAQPIDVSALRQEPVRDASRPPPNPLEDLLIRAGQGRRGAAPTVPEWTAQLTRFTIKAEGAPQ